MQFDKYIYKIYVSDIVHIEKFPVIFEEPNGINVKVHGSRELCTIHSIYHHELKGIPSLLMEAVKTVCKQRASNSYLYPLYILSTPTYPVTKEEVKEAKKYIRDMIKKEQIEKCKADVEIARIAYEKAMNALKIAQEEK